MRSFPQRRQEFTVLSKTSHETKNHTEVYLTVFLVLLMLELNKIRCIIIKNLFCLLRFVPTRRLRVDFSIVLWWWATTFCWKRLVVHGLKKAGNHWPRLCTF